MPEYDRISPLSLDVIVGKPKKTKEPIRREEYRDIIQDLTADGGVVVRHVITAYVKRVEELAKQDIACCTYMSILEPIKREINLGEAIRRSMEKEILSK